jgi:MFS family permease
MLFLLPQYVQYVQDDSALAAGLELAPFGLGLGALATVGGRLMARYGPRVVLLAGLLTTTAGFVPCCFSPGIARPRSWRSARASSAAAWVSASPRRQR